MSELSLYVVREPKFWTSCDDLSAMREIKDYVLYSRIALTSSHDKLFKKIRAALLAWQQYHPQFVEV